MNEQATQDRVAENYEALRHKLPYAKRYHDWWLQLMVKMARTNGRVLDNGCGVGPMFALLHGQQELVGADLSYEMLRRAKTKTADVGLAQADSLHLPFANTTFDLIYARALLHHFPNPEVGIAEMHRILKPGGQVILADTNQSILSAIPRKIAYRSDNFSDDHSNLDRHQYLEWVSSYFEIERVHFFGYLAYPFGFPDMMGPIRRVPFPPILVSTLIQIDNVISRIPVVKTQSWGLIVSAFKK